MRTGHAFRSIGIALAIVIALSLAGCGALGGGGGGCGPGETKISELDPSSTQQTSIEGEVTVAGPGSVILDDGSGQAFVMLGQNDLSEGDCVSFTGYPSPIPGGTQADVGFTPTNATTA